MLPLYNTQTFTEIFPDYDSFKDTIDNDFDSYCKNILKENELLTLYWMLYSRYGENPITNYTVSVFKAKMVAIIFAKGPSWAKKLDIQNKLRNLTDEEITLGSKSILNKALHPETDPTTDTTDELSYINSQDVTKQKRSLIDGYSYLDSVLKNDVSEEFISAFKPLFSKFVSPTITRIYENEIKEEEEDE